MLNPAVKIRRAIYSGPLILLVVVLAAVIVLYAPSKFIAAFALLPVMALLYIGAPHFAKIVFPMTMITFPITLQYSGRDAFSTGTLIIFVTLTWALTKYRISATVGKDKFLFSLLLLLVCIAFIGMVTKTSGEYWGPAVRHYLNFISSIAVFVLIIHSQQIRGTANNERDYIEKIISALLLITVLHVLLSLLILSFPWMEKYFTVFFNRTQEHLSGYFIDGVYTRATTVFTSGEGFGELFILLFPFSLYKFFVSKNKLYLFVIASLFLGTMLSGTRSVFLLIVFQFLVFVYILVARKYNTKRFIITVGSIFICVLVLSSVLNYSSVLMDRVQITLNQVKSKVSDQVGSKVPGQVKSKVQDRVRSKVDIVTIVNRQGLWPMAYDLTKDTISLFGHGPIQAHGLGFPVRNFHCLYLSMLFQFGIMGTAVFLLFFYTMAKRLLKPVKKIKYKSTDYLLAVTCLLSLLCFLINEIKFEFNRSDSYQQFVWIIFAVFYLTGQLWRNSTHEKTHYHQPGPIRASH